ncbi:MAG: CPBP family intramembrane glutamic endopeptidase [Myxococcota bacterium]
MHGSRTSISFGRVLAGATVAWGVLIGLVALARRANEALDLGEPWSIVSAGILPAVVAAAASLPMARLASGRPIAASDLGLQFASGRAMAIGLLGGIPLIVAYAIIFAGLGVSAEPRPWVGVWIVKFVVAQGIAEEIIFRGFVFKCLRRGRSFLRASTLSAVIFSLVHLSNLMNGLTAEVIIGALISTVFAFVLTYPACLLFERSGVSGSVLPFALTHVLIDSINFFVHVGGPGPAMLIYLGATLVTALLIFLLARFLLPPAAWTKKPLAPPAEEG